MQTQDLSRLISMQDCLYFFRFALVGYSAYVQGMLEHKLCFWADKSDPVACTCVPVWYQFSLFHLISFQANHQLTMQPPHIHSTTSPACVHHHHTIEVRHSFRPRFFKLDSNRVSKASGERLAPGRLWCRSKRFICLILSFAPSPHKSRSLCLELYWLLFFS